MKAYNYNNPGPMIQKYGSKELFGNLLLCIHFYFKTQVECTVIRGSPCMFDWFDFLKVKKSSSKWKWPKSLLFDLVWGTFFCKCNSLLTKIRIYEVCERFLHFSISTDFYKLQFFMNFYEFLYFPRFLTMDFNEF